MIARILGLSVMLASPLAAQAPSNEPTEQAQSPLDIRAADVVSVIQGDLAAEEVLADVFLAAVPAAQLETINAQMVSQFGPVIAVESVMPQSPTTAEIVFRFEKALGHARLSIEAAAPHKINGLRFVRFEAIDDSPAKIQAELEALPGDVSVLFTRLDGSASPTLALNPDQQSAIGSTFKLYILSALARSIEGGERAWSDVVELNRRSFPSGRLQDWPEGAPVTLHTLATLMVSISDNTATDMLLHEVGREAVEAELIDSAHTDPARTLPLLGTLEMFALKGSPGNLRKYQEAGEAGRRAILADFEDDVGGNPDLVTPPRFVEPTAIDTVEWFANGPDLQQLLSRLAAQTDPTAREIMAVSPSLPEATIAQWAYAGFKGGLEPGVLNLTWLLQDKAGHWYILTMSWNDTEAALDSETFGLLSQRIIALPRE